MDILLSDELRDIIRISRYEAARTGSPVIRVDHLLLAILRKAGSRAYDSIVRAGIDPAELKEAIDGAISSDSAISYSEIGNIRLSRGAGSILAMAGLEALREGLSTVFPPHILLALTRAEGTGPEFLRTHGLDYNTLKTQSGSPGSPSETAHKATGYDYASSRNLLDALGEQLGNLISDDLRSLS